MLKLHSKSCLSCRFLQKQIEETAESFAVPDPLLCNIASTGQQAVVFPMDIKDACLALLFPAQI